jgi:hypothetical protein
MAAAVIASKSSVPIVATSTSVSATIVECRRAEPSNAEDPKYSPGCKKLSALSQSAGAASRSEGVAPSGGEVMRRTRPSMIRYLPGGGGGGGGGWGGGLMGLSG